jgi:hypothetical protein
MEKYMNDDANTSNRDADKPAYVPYKTFTNFVSTLKESGLPNRIDRSVLAGQSGATQSFLLSTFRFLGLISNDGTPTPALKELTSHAEDSEGYKAAWRKIIESKYAFLLNGGFKAESATESQFLEKLQEKGVSGETARKSLTFFTLACEKAGIKLSPHLKSKRGSGNGRPRKRRDTQPEPPVHTPPPESNSSLQDKLINKFPDFDPSWPDDLKKKWFDGFEQFSKSIRSE